MNTLEIIASIPLGILVVLAGVFLLSKAPASTSGNPPIDAGGW